MSRREQPDLYDTPEKEEYREKVWGMIRRELCARPSGRGSACLLLPGPTDLEIQAARAHGIAPKNIHLSFTNAAHAANWTKRYGAQHPGVHVYGKRAAAVCRKLARKGTTLAFANLDFCGNFSADVVEQVRGVASANVWDEEALLGFTCLRGRENNTEALALLRLLTGHLDKRSGDGMRVEALALIARATFGGATRWWRILSASYPSGTQTMEYGVFRFRPERLRHRKEDAASGTSYTSPLLPTILKTRRRYDDRANIHTRVRVDDRLAGDVGCGWGGGNHSGTLGPIEEVKVNPEDPWFWEQKINDFLFLREIACRFTKATRRLTREYNCHSGYRHPGVWELSGGFTSEALTLVKRFEAIVAHIEEEMRSDALKAVVTDRRP